MHYENLHSPIPDKNKRVGVIGGGQLAGMMAAVAKSLGIELVVQTPYASDPAVAIASQSIFASIDDAAATAKLATLCDVITFENEFINLEALTPLAEQGVCFHPSLAALAPLLDKYQQRCYLQEIGLPQPDFISLGASGQSINLNELEFPLVLKVRRQGYDGKGTLMIQDRPSLDSAWQQLEYQPVMLEEFVGFERELAVIAARSLTGDVVVYPVVETQQEEQVCRRVIVPADISSTTIAEIEAIATTLLQSLQVVGVFGIELFLTTSGKVLVNEVSPRTHNSGHYTLDACETSQFEQQLRAVVGLPLGSPTMHCTGAVMVNLLGYEHSQDNYWEKRQKLANLPHSFVHWYGKSQSRPGRKLGHVTVLGKSSQRNWQQGVIETVESLWYG
ncbi:MAG: 5-(carboxyamino)imidazole ribonucleotide synthase [Symploca sp. SIO2E6]|nr:5-(carboxyamino)imidazole ribonucleotide synthase [Symploca sp. SIO2E6]